MPGIVGMFTRMPRERARVELASMLRSMMHEDAYVSGTGEDAALGVHYGWVARRGSFSDCMPLKNEAGDRELVFAGEEFPDADLRSRLVRQGHTLEQGPAAHLVHVAEEDPRFPASLNGRFHGLLLDRARGVATLFNDRYGLQRLYYHQSAEAFYFAAEAKAILAVRPELRALDARGLGEYVSCGCVLENRTLFSGVRVLPPASAWTFRQGHMDSEGTYFTPQEWEQLGELEPEDYYRELRDVFTRNLPRYFDGPEAIGISLTGGLDTRMILAWLPREQRPNCYSFGGMFRDCQDVAVARRVADARGQSHQVIPVGGDFLSDFPRLAERTVYLTDGSVGVDHTADLYVNQRAAHIAPVRMTGNYGGEVLRRVRAFKPMRGAHALFSSDLNLSIQTARSTYEQVIQAHPLSFAVFRQAPWHHFALLGLEQTQVTLRSPFLDNDFVRTVFRAPASACRNSDVSLRLIADGSPAMSAIPTDRGKRYGHHGIWDRAAAEWQEFTAKAEYAYDYGMPQWLARTDQVLRGLHLERLFLGRHKFYHYRVWYRDLLGDYVKQILLDARTLSRPYFERYAVEAMVRGHVGGGENHTLALHKALSLELLQRSLLENGTV